MTLEQAIERKRWDLVALLLLHGVSLAAAQLPPESLAALLDIAGGEEGGPIGG